MVDCIIVSVCISKAPLVSASVGLCQVSGDRASVDCIKCLVTVYHYTIIQDLNCHILTV